MKYYIADAFTDKLFSGNPAGVCTLDKWISPELMQNIAIENNLAETAFVVPKGDSYGLRWFTPGGEIDLCGHATLAAAFILSNFVDKNAQLFLFDTKSGILTVRKKRDMLEMDFPSFELKPVPVTDQITAALGVQPNEVYMGRDLVCVLEDETQVLNTNPDQEKLLELEGLLLHITAKGTAYDCVSRTFAPKVKITEDQVCGSGHCHIAPLWSEKLDKCDIVAKQASKRGGILYCTVDSGRTKLSGKAVLYLRAELNI